MNQTQTLKKFLKQRRTINTSIARVDREILVLKGILGEKRRKLSPAQREFVPYLLEDKKAVYIRRALEGSSPLLRELANEALHCLYLKGVKNCPDAWADFQKVHLELRNSLAASRN